MSAPLRRPRYLLPVYHLYQARLLAHLHLHQIESVNQLKTNMEAYPVPNAKDLWADPEMVGHLRGDVNLSGFTW